MIESKIYTIKDERLKPFVQYILFNKTSFSGSSATSFSNSNVCLGILNGSKMIRTKEGDLSNVDAQGIHFYLSGMYLRPHKFVSGAYLDEICIDFTPLGYYHFFDFPLHKYILDSDVILDSFGKSAPSHFTQIFAKDCEQLRGIEIEKYLLSKMKTFDNPFIQESYHVLNNNKTYQLSESLNKIKASERKIQRTFKHYFGITPKQFLRINRFRRSLRSLTNTNQLTNLTNTAYNFGFTDQSHFNKEIKFFTGQSPLKLKTSLTEIDKQVIVAM